MSNRLRLVSMISLAVAFFWASEGGFADSLEILCPVASPVKAYDHTTPLIISQHDAVDEMTVTNWACSDMDEIPDLVTDTEGSANSGVKKYHRSLFTDPGASDTKVWTAYAFGQKPDDTYECAVAHDFQLTDGGVMCQNPVGKGKNVAKGRNKNRELLRFTNSPRFTGVTLSLHPGRVVQIAGSYDGPATKVRAIIIRKHGKIPTQLKSSSMLSGTGSQAFTVNNAAATPKPAPQNGDYYVILFAGHDIYIARKDNVH